MLSKLDACTELHYWRFESVAFLGRATVGVLSRRKGEGEGLIG